MKLKLIFNVEYHPETLKGMDTNELKTNLEDIARNAFGEGTITGDTPAEIDNFSYEVTEQPIQAEKLYRVGVDLNYICKEKHLEEVKQVILEDMQQFKGSWISVEDAPEANENEMPEFIDCMENDGMFND